MNTLNYYELAVADPYSTDPDFLDAVTNDAALQTVVNDAKENDKIFQSFVLDIPAPSQAHLNAINSMCDEQESTTGSVAQLPKRRLNSFKPYFAIAASFAVMTISVFMLSGNNDYNHNLMEHALNHTSHGAPFAGVTDTSPTLTRVNQQLSLYGAKLTNADHILWSSHCEFEGIASAHLVYKDQAEKINVFLVPKSFDYDAIKKQFSNADFNGTITELARGYLVVVAPKNSNINQIRSNIEEQLDWDI